MIYKTIKSLSKYDMPLSLYLFLKLIQENEITKTKQIKNIDTVINLTNVEDLVINMYMFAEMQNNNYVLTQEGKDFISTIENDTSVINIDELFKIFWAAYPLHTPSYNGKVRIIRAEKEKCKQIYKRIVTSQEIHDKIILLLNLEIKRRMLQGDMQFMPSPARYLRGKMYESFEEFINKQNENNNSRYGQRIV